MYCWHVRSLDVHILAGTTKFLQSHPGLVGDMVLKDYSELPQCRKDLGEQGRLRHWSRGHIFVVRSCGHVDLWAPIFKWEPWFSLPPSLHHLNVHVYIKVFYHYTGLSLPLKSLSLSWDGSTRHYSTYHQTNGEKSLCHMTTCVTLTV